MNVIIVNERNIKEIVPGAINLSSFQPQDVLNPKIWVNNKINSNVRIKLLDIASDFFDTLGIGWIKPVDIVITGSIAGYNWSKYSDIDLHIILDFSEIYNDINILQNLFDSKKNEWNNEHKDLKLYGYIVEVYVQDVKSDVTSNGIYSLIDNKWLKMPEKLTDYHLDKEFIKKMASKLINQIDNLSDKIKNTVDDKEMDWLLGKVKTLFDKIKFMRKSDLHKYGEMSNGNVIFKTLRRMGYLDKLWELKTSTYDKIHSFGK